MQLWRRRGQVRSIKVFDGERADPVSVLVFDNRLVGNSTVSKDKADDAADFELEDLADDVVKLVQVRSRSSLQA